MDTLRELTMLVARLQGEHFQLSSNVLDYHTRRVALVA